MKKILITGGSGFIGRNLKEYLSNKYSIFAPAHEELDLLDTDAVRSYILKNKIRVIIHCANTELAGMLGLNLHIFFNIIRNEELVERIIHLGSGAEYDKSRPIINIKEKDFGQRMPTDNLGFYKYICSRYIEGTKKIVCLRPFGVYGKYEDWKFKFISNAIVKNLLKLDITINQNVVFDYLYIDDLLIVIEYFLTHWGKYKFYNVTSDKSIDLLEISRRINSISPYQSSIKILRKGLNNQYTGDNGRLKEEIKNLHFTSYQEGIRKLFYYYQNL